MLYGGATSISGCAITETENSIKRNVVAIFIGKL